MPYLGYLSGLLVDSERINSAFLLGGSFVFLYVRITTTQIKHNGKSRLSDYSLTGAGVVTCQKLVERLLLFYLLPMNITIYRTYNEVANGFLRDVTYVLDRIKKGTSAELTAKIRACKDKDARNALKRKLPAINFQGTFKERNAKGLIEFSGLMPLDFDNFPNAQELAVTRKILTANKYTYSLFTSPSGNGLKVIVRVPKDGAKNYKAYFDSLRKYYDSPYFDISCSDISRLCFESHDPELYINPNSEIYTDKIEPEIKPKNPVVNNSPPKYATDRKARYIEKSFDNARKIISSSIQGNRHNARLRAGELLGGYVGGGFYSMQAAFDAIESTVMCNTTLPIHVAMKDIKDGIEHGLLRPITIEQKEFERQIYLSQNQRREVNKFTGEVM